MPEATFIVDSLKRHLPESDVLELEAVLKTLHRLCKLFSCEVGDLFEFRAEGQRLALGTESKGQIGD